MTTPVKALGLVVLAALAVVVLVSVGAGTHEKQLGTDPQSAPSTSTPLIEHNPTPSPVPEEGHDHSDHDELDSAKADVVEKFAARFSAPTSQRQWVESLAPLVTPDLLAGFKYTEPQVRPRGKVTSLAELHPAGAFEVTYSSGLSIRLTLVSTGERWLVASVEPITDPIPDGSDA